MRYAMPRYKNYDYAQSLLLPVNFKEQIIPGTLEYTIHFIVEEKIDISPLEKRFNNEETGAPAYDPKILLKIVLLAYARGVISSRRIERLCRENVVFKALSAATEPDFTTIAHFIRSMKNEVRQLFSDVLLYCVELDLLGGTTFALDGCKLPSNASKEYSGTFADLKRKRDKLEKTVRMLVKQHGKNDSRDREAKKREKRRVARMKQKIGKIDSFLAGEKPKVKTRQGEKQSNITDNESAKIKTSKGVIQGYNGMALADDKHQVVVAAEAFGNGQEYELLKPLVSTAKENARYAGLGKRFFEGKRLIADTGSFCEENIKYLSSEKIDAYIPDQQFRKRDPRFIDRDRYKPPKRSLYTKEDFTYFIKSNTFVCPEKRILKFHTRQTFNNTTGRVYRALLSDCRKCSRREKCLRSVNTRQRSLYVIEKYFNRNFSEEMKAKIDTLKGRKIYSARMGIIEPVFANMCSAKGLNRFTLRTKKKVNVQWMLYCMVHTIGKVCRYG
ncbi:MAG: transposase [Spirochaetes bacterium]|nr:MAG: transposase [Spirochaetota bacterium]